ncbi:MAG: GNAT family N-acetyltransferase [Tepidiformaceae bacterium]
MSRCGDASPAKSAEARIPNPKWAEERDVKAVVCFVVAKPFRGRGIATRLLSAACDGFRARGVHTVEAWLDGPWAKNGP